MHLNKNDSIYYVKIKQTYMYYIKEKSEILNASISKFANFESADKSEIENILKFGINAIGILEGLVDNTLEPLLKAKKELYETQLQEKVKELLVKVATDFYYELNEAQDIVYRFSALSQSFNIEIRPILLKYFDMEEVEKWKRIINSTYDSRAICYERIESLIPKIENFVEARYYNNVSDNLTFKEIRNYINEVIEEVRSTKKELQSAKANFLQLSGINELTSITTNKLSSKNTLDELENKLNKVKELVTNGRIETALEELEMLCIYNYPVMLKDIILLQSQYHINMRNFYMNIDEDKTITNRISIGILEMIKEITKLKDIINNK